MGLPASRTVIYHKDFQTDNPQPRLVRGRPSSMLQCFTDLLADALQSVEAG